MRTMQVMLAPTTQVRTRTLSAFMPMSLNHTELIFVHLSSRMHARTHARTYALPLKDTHLARVKQRHTTTNSACKFLTCLDSTCPASPPNQKAMNSSQVSFGTHANCNLCHLTRLMCCLTFCLRVHVTVRTQSDLLSKQLFYHGRVYVYISSSVSTEVIVDDMLGIFPAYIIRYAHSQRK